MDELIYDNIYGGYRAKEVETDTKKHRPNLIRRMQVLKGNNIGIIETIFRNNEISYDVFSGWIKKYEQRGKTVCICGHIISNIYQVRYGDTSALIGCECIKNFDPDLYESLKEIELKIKNDSYCTICEKDCKADHFDTEMHKNRFKKALAVIFKKHLLEYYKYIDEKRRIKDIVKLQTLKIIYRINREKIMMEQNLVECKTCSTLIPNNPYRPQCLDCWKRDKNEERKKVYKTSECQRRASKNYYHKTGVWNKDLPK